MERQTIDFEEGPALTFELRAPTLKEILQLMAFLPDTEEEDESKWTPKMKADFAIYLTEAAEQLCSNFRWESDPPEEVEWSDLPPMVQMAVSSDAGQLALQNTGPKARRSTNGPSDGVRERNRRQRMEKKKSKRRQ